jgi:PKD repeat protein
VNLTVASGAGTPTGNVVVTASGGGETCTGAAPAGSCQIILTGTGDRTLTATYSGDEIFAGSSGTVIHHVNEPVPNNPPTAAFTHADCTAGVDCQFTDGSTDSDGTIVAWDWDFGDLSLHSNQQSPTHNYIVGAEFQYSVTLTVTDNQGTTSSTTQLVTVH